MISDAEREELVAAAGETIRRGSKSFALASRLFDRTTRDRAWLLYAWCRYCDDVCDGQTLGWTGERSGISEDRLSYLTSRTDAALRGVVSGALPFDGLAAVCAECTLPHRFLRDHLAGFAMDLEGWRPDTEEELLLYCYRVAGVVGCMMAILMGVSPEDEETLDRAADLGIAFQLANIARDIVDDAAMGRCYLPAEWMTAHDLMPETIVDPGNAERLAQLAKRLVTLASAYEVSGRAGALRLPFRARWAVLTAAGVYGAIGRLVVQRGGHAWRRRAAVSRSVKLGWCARALWQACRRGGRDPDRIGLWTRRHNNCDLHSTVAAQHLPSPG